MCHQLISRQCRTSTACSQTCGREQSRIRRKRRFIIFCRSMMRERDLQDFNLNQRSHYSSSNPKTKSCRPFLGKSRESCRLTNLANRQKSPSFLKFVKAISTREYPLNSKQQAKRKSIAGMALLKVTGLPTCLQIETHSLPNATASSMKPTATYQLVLIAKRCLLSSISSYQVILLNWRFARIHSSKQQR